jgi:Protein of unknown function (DUF2510)
MHWPIPGRREGGRMSDDGTGRPSISGAIPAGWYPDPAGGNGKRWWDGARWTDNLREPEVAPTPPSFGNYVHPEFRPTTPLPTAEAGIAYTRSSWWLASSPLWIVVPQAVIVEIFNALAPPPLESLVVGLALLNILALAILVRLAFADRAALVRGENATVASPWWTLLTPLAYLIVRAREVQLYATGGWASVLWWCVAAFFSPGIAVLAVFAVYGLV